MQKNSTLQEQSKINDKIIFQIIEKNKEKGVSITEIVELSKQTRSAVRIILARFEGAGIVEVRRAGMAKLYFFKKIGEIKNPIPAKTYLQ